MKKTFILISLFFLFKSQAQTSNWTLTEMTPMPEAVTNNAVCEGFINGVTGQIPYVFSFGGIDSSLAYTGIHNKAWRYSVESDTWESIADLPDSQETIASSASYVNGKIYIIGGYTVAANGNEVSSNKVLIYDVQSNSYQTNGANIPVAIDDQVQCVYKDSLIFIVTGWSNNGNVTDVQIYDTYNNNWLVGTSVPNNTDFRVFGSNGTIVGDTLFYYGGANTTANFPATNRMKKGYINPNDPTDITWSIVDINIFNTYRMACTSVSDTVFWIGGSEISYNYNAEAYNGSGIVNPKNVIVSYSQRFLEAFISFELPMDLRGIANVSNSVKYLCGGIENNAKVSNKTLRLEWRKPLNTNLNSLIENEVSFQNPILNKTLTLNEVVKIISIYNCIGELVFQTTNNSSKTIDLSYLSKGVYFLNFENRKMTKSFIE